MNTDTTLNDLSIKEALCKHFNMPADRSDLTTCEKRFPSLGGDQLRHYCFMLKDSRERHRAFGKVAGYIEWEYRVLQYLMKTVPKGQRHIIGPPIALLKDGSHSLLLLEYLEGYSNPFTILNSLRLFPNRALNITRMGKYMLDEIYGLQKHAPAIYRPVSLEDTDATPGQPLPIGVFKQIESIKSISIETKAALHNRINAILQNQIMVRRGVVHGSLGMRNIMVSRSNIAFIDWEYMQYEGLSIYDPCYIATMLLMKGVQLFVPRSKLDMISNSLFKHIEYLEDRLTETKNETFIHDGLWFGRCLAMIDTLWQYERRKCSRLKASLARERRQIEYLAYRIEKDAKNDESNSNACEVWRSRWPNYIKVSKRRSSSAMLTADNFIKMTGISEGSRILDLGCGHGRITELLVEKVPSLDIVGVDVTRELLDRFIVRSGANESKIKLVCADITKLPLDDDGFDAVVSSRVFQYLPNPLLGIREAVRVLKPGGVVVISIPNKLNVIKYFNYKGRLYSPFQVRDWFNVCGLEEIECGSMCFFPSSVRWVRLAGFLENAGNIPIVKYLGGNVLVKGRKKVRHEH